MEVANGSPDSHPHSLSGDAVLLYLQTTCSWRRSPRPPWTALPNPQDEPKHLNIVRDPQRVRTDVSSLRPFIQSPDQRFDQLPRHRNVAIKRQFQFANAKRSTVQQWRGTERDEVGAVGDGLVVEVGDGAGGPEAGGDGLEELDGEGPA